MSGSSGTETSSLAVAGAVVAGKYRLEAPVGAGGMGSVWSATHVSLGQRLAIKLISSDLAKSPDALRRFDVEAKAAVQIRSRHVPQVFDNGVLDDGTPFIVMELLHGEPLLKRLERMGGVGLAESVSILAQCCRALSRAHALGIVHRDIKPDNIFLAQSDEDDGYVVKVLDFGVAKMPPVTVGDEASVTRTGSLVGTPAFMSPEQARGLGTIDARSDLYSLGLVAYQMLTGRQCFDAQSLGDLLMQICVKPLPSLLAAAPSLPASMEAWFQRACGRTPDERFATAAAFSDALVAASELSPIDLASAGGPLRSGSSIPALGASSGGHLVAAAHSAPRMTSTTGASSLSGEPPPPRASRRSGALLAAALGVLTLLVAITAVTLVARARRGSDDGASVAAGGTAPTPPGIASDVPPPPALPAIVDQPASAAAIDGAAVAIAPDAAPGAPSPKSSSASSSTARPPAASRPAPAVPSAPATARPNENAVGY